LVVTVDAPVLGRRERDIRNKLPVATDSVGGKWVNDSSGNDSNNNNNNTSNDDNKNNNDADDADANRRRRTLGEGGVSNTMTSLIDPSLTWECLRHFTTHVTSLPLIVKGIQCGRDAVRAVHSNDNCVGLILSNHGGRQLDGCRSSIDVLPEVIVALRRAGYHVGRDPPSPSSATSAATTISQSYKRHIDVYIATYPQHVRIHATRHRGTDQKLAAHTLPPSPPPLASVEPP
jgi:isopentenyl diphosphate isomerase/L-lactate dehydrogenase-like FMN-dependent dehydrogenase